jgi:hypothetical protein
VGEHILLWPVGWRRSAAPHRRCWKPFDLTSLTVPAQVHLRAALCLLEVNHISGDQTVIQRGPLEAPAVAEATRLERNAAHTQHECAVDVGGQCMENAGAEGAESGRAMTTAEAQTLAHLQVCVSFQRLSPSSQKSPCLLRSLHPKPRPKPMHAPGG